MPSRHRLRSDEHESVSVGRGDSMPQSARKPIGGVHTEAITVPRLPRRVGACPTLISPPRSGPPRCVSTGPEASPPFACRSTLPNGPRRGFEWTAPLVALRLRKSPRRRAPRPAAGPPTRAIAGARARAVTMATMRPPKHLNSRGQRLMFTEMEDQPRAARRAEDEARVLFL